jgi:aspartokinase/homoserine dehydrogenase 1
MHKFGGASLADAELYRTCGNILIDQSTLDGISTPTAAVVSAMKGMTDKLVDVVETAAKADGLAESREKLEAIVTTHVSTAIELLVGHNELKKDIIENITADSKDIDALLISTNLLRTVQNSTMELVAGTGEVWSAQLLSHT